MSATGNEFSARLKPGGRLGRFELLRALGAGGMGAVYLARDTLLDVQVALKVLNPSIAHGEGLERFRREVLLARRVTHPGVCRLFDIHSDDGLFYLSMEYVEGPTLQRVLREAGQLAAPLAVALLRAACQAMQAAHAHDVVHRDLKPGNLIVRGPERVTILDFGLSKARDQRDITEAGFQVGTMHYMSPEVVRGDEASKRSDVYSLGVILYECACGRLPFDGNNVLDLQLAIVDGRAVPPRRFVRKLSDDLEQIILQAMQRDPAQRFGSCAALEHALASLRLGPLEPAWSQARGNDARVKRPGERASLRAPTLPELVDPEADRPTLAPAASLARPRGLAARDTDADVEATVPTLLDVALEPPLPAAAPVVAELSPTTAPRATASLSQSTLRVRRPRAVAADSVPTRRWLLAGGSLVLTLGVLLGVALTRHPGEPPLVTPAGVPGESAVLLVEERLPVVRPAPPLPASAPAQPSAQRVAAASPAPQEPAVAPGARARRAPQPPVAPASPRPLEAPPPLVSLAEQPPAAIDAQARRTRLARQDRRRLRQELQAAMRERGVRPGDAPPLDGALHELALALREGRGDDAQQWHTRAVAALAAVAVDRRFVEAKLLRFNQRFDQAGSPRGEERLIDLSQGSIDAIERGDYEQANRQLNQALELLERRPR